MDLTHGVQRCRSATQPTFINPLLDLNVRFGFELQIPLDDIFAVVVLKCPFDIDGMGVMAFDQIAVVAVHRTN